MKKRSMTGVFAILVVITMFAGLPAAAQATRTWVSGVGDDANPCSRTAPCKTFAGAISKTAAGGEISVLDPGGFGAVTITKSITIRGEGTLAGILAAGTNGIIVNVAASDFVAIRNVSIEGAGTGLNGIRFIGGGTLLVEDCTINNFTQKGIDFQPATGSSSAPARLLVADTSITNNINNPNGGAIYARPAAAGVYADATIENSRLDRNRYGIRIEDRVKLYARNTTASQSSNFGFLAFSAAGGFGSSMMLTDCLSASNSIGVRAEGAGALLRISGVTITGNGTGIDVAGGVVSSLQNNNVSGNTVDGTANGVYSPK